MKGPLSIALLLMLAACSGPSPEPLPDSGSVDRLESLLAGRECVGALNEWERHYFHPLLSGERKVADTSVIAFDFREAGKFEFREGRRIETVWDATAALDHRQFRSASGIFNLGSGILEVQQCGWNCGPSTPADGNCG
jgi:hypothetical protein